MIRVVIYLLVVALAAAGFAWLADRPGDIQIVWQNQQVDTSVMAGLIGLGILAVVAITVWSLARFVLHSPGAVGGFFRDRRRERGYQALSRGMIAVGAGDPRLASQCADNAERLLSDEPLTLLLKAQTAQLHGDRTGAEGAFTAMLDEPGTRALGLHGLFVEAQRAGDRAAAREYAARASQTAPSLGWAGDALFAFQSAENDWDAALKTLQRNADNKLIDKETARRHRAVLLTAQAMELEDSEPNRALALAGEAHRLALDLVPAAVVAGRLHAQAGDLRRATRVLEATWKLAPHPDIAEIYAHARPGDSARDRLKRIRTLIHKHPNTQEGTLALAATAIEARDFLEARQVLGTFLKVTPTQRACLLMAELEEAEYGDSGRVREWLGRAVRAPRDAAWTADGYVSDSWAPVSPITGRIDAFEWKVPAEQIAGPETGWSEADFAPPNGGSAEKPVVIDAKPNAPEEAAKPEPEKAGAEAKPEASPRPEAARPSDVASSEEPVVRFPLNHAPDDPGPENGEDPKRMRLF